MSKIMNNIFEGAKFGDKFITRDGRIAIYHRFETKLNLHVLFVENLDCCLYCEDNGLHTGNHVNFPEWDEDIVSRYQESINEKELEQLADEYAECEPIQNNYTAFKAGYRSAFNNKAKEEYYG